MTWPEFRRALAVLLLAPLGACNFYYNTLPSPDDAVKLVPWFDHMVKSQAMHPYERSDVPRTTVPGTVPVTGAEPDWRAEFAANNLTTADRLVNPTDPAATLAQGDTLFHRFCAVCHGSTGAGDGPVAPKIGSRSLLTPVARAFSDGYLYSMIRYGRGIMPRYGDKLHTPAQRWAVVNYVRKLQADALASAGGTP